MTRSSVFIPPAPMVHPKDLPIGSLLWNAIRSSLAIWPDYAFDILTARNKVFGLETVLVNDPEAIRYVLISQAQNYQRPVSVRRIARVLGNEGLFVAEGGEWRRQRRLLAPTFSPSSINLLLPHFQEAGLHLLRTVSTRSSVNLSRAFHDTALEAVLRALFSMPENQAREKLSDIVRNYIEGPGRPNLFDIFAKADDDFAFATRGRKRLRNAWFLEIDKIIADRQAMFKTSDERDVLDLLLGIRDADTGETLSDSEIRDQCGTMFFAGSETTARAMFWAAYLLTQDMKEQGRIRAEVMAFPVERVSNIDDLQNWPHLRNVLLETLRLYPPLPHIVRQAIRPDEVAGEKVAPGTQVWFSPWVLHRHRKFWDQPTAFIPSRFAGTAAPWMQIPAYIPFGAGPRICIGLSFALTEAQIVLATLLARYQVSLPVGKPVLPVGRVTIEPSYEPLFQLERS